MNFRIIDRLKRGDEETFKDIFKSYYPRLLSFSLEYVYDYESAREIVQDAMLKLWENKNKLRDDSNISAFLYKIVKNNSINLLKHRIARNNYLNYTKSRNLDYQLNLAALSNFSVDHIEFKQLTDAIETAINTLPPKCKKVFELSRFQNLTYKEIGAKLNISVKTVENHISVALRKINIQIVPYI